MTFIDLLNAYHIMPQFPPAAAVLAGRMPERVSDIDLLGRTDLTDKQIFTIDGDDAKDFDDAVSIELLDSGSYLLGVHIADVSHYVKENSPIDHAAFLRGTSVYLIDTVIPMLPFELSNELCSLKPHELRLTVSVFMEITPVGRVESYRICESFIKSCERMTYANVTKLLEGDEELCVRYSHILSSLRHMKRLAGILNKKRISEGAVEFVTHESKITLDKDGKPVNVERYPTGLSNDIIEEFMLICNRTVARHLGGLGLPCVYRVHEKPDMMRMERLGEILPVLGVDFEFSTEMKPKDFQRILKSVEGTEIFDVVNYIVLRSMSKAKYCEKNIGHFGLAFSDYCHFTSPIRRYPDLVVHRILKESLHHRIDGARLESLKELAIGTSVSSSISEVNAAEAELAWKAVKKTEYMAERLGEKYSGIITHVTSSGFFVELENTVEGFVPARTIEDDVYILSDNGLSLSGLKTRKKYTIGDTVGVKTAAVDFEQNRIDFELTGQKPAIIYRRKSRGGAGKGLSKKDRHVLKEIKSENKEIRRQKNESRDKLDFERKIFENAVSYVLTDTLCERHRYKNQDKRFVGITISDMSAMIILPLYKNHIYDSADFQLKACIISATHLTDTTIAALEEGFGQERDEGLHRFAKEYVRAALRHFDACMRHSDMNRAKREHEYDMLARKIKQKTKEGALR